MADTKTTDLAELTAPSPLDRAMLVDVSDTSMAASGTNKDIALGTLLGALTSNVISGLTLSNNTTDASNDIDIAAGVATVSDGTSWHLASLASTLVKRLDAAWAVGTNQGGLDTGTEANSTWYHVWLIQRSDTGVVDVLFSVSATAPTMPSVEYDRKRRIGAIYNNSSGNIAAFTQLLDTFIWSTPPADVTATNPGTSAVLRTMSVPTGVSVIVDWAASIIDATFGAASIYGLISSPAAADVTPSGTAGTHNMIVTLGGLSPTILAGASSGRAITNTSGQLRSRLNVSDADITLRMFVLAWRDPRGNT